MSQYNLHVLCVAAYNMLGVPLEAHEGMLGGRLFGEQDVGSVFWVGVGDVYVRGGKRSLKMVPSEWMPPGTVGVVTGVHGDHLLVASVVYLNYCRDKSVVIVNPVLVA